MSVSITDAIRQLTYHKGVSEDLVLKMVEEVLLAAYSEKFGTSENAVSQFDEETGEMQLYARKKVVERVEEPVYEMTLEEARKSNGQCEISDEVLVQINPLEMGRIAAQAARKVVMSRLKEMEQNSIYSEYSQKIGQIVNGKYQRHWKGHIYVNLDRTEAILPKREQSPKEFFSAGERIKAIIVNVENRDNGSQVILSRAHPLFVQRLFEVDIPEIADGTIQVKAVVREPGFRTKMTVYSEEMDPVGACVGMKGMRIQSIIRELEGERIDVIRYNENIKEYIANAFSPAKVHQIVVLNESQRHAMAVVEEDQLALSIGRQGHNVKLVCKLTGWEIDVKTISEFHELGYEDESRLLAENIFQGEPTQDETEESSTESFHSISELTSLPDEIIEIIKTNGIHSLEELVSLPEQALLKMQGMDSEKVSIVLESIQKDIVVMENEPVSQDKSEPKTEQQETESDEIYSYFCPECETELPEEVEKCPKCGVELQFE